VTLKDIPTWFEMGWSIPVYEPEAEKKFNFNFMSDKKEDEKKTETKDEKKTTEEEKKNDKKNEIKIEKIKKPEEIKDDSRKHLYLKLGNLFFILFQKTFQKTFLLMIN
jgi:hypothetical protein